MSETISFVDHNFMVTRLPQIVFVLFMLFPRLYLGANIIISMIQICFITFHENVYVCFESESQNERKHNNKEKEDSNVRGCGFKALTVNAIYHAPFNRLKKYGE